jgi:hypothetical protein
MAHPLCPLEGEGCGAMDSTKTRRKGSLPPAGLR